MTRALVSLVLLPLLAACARQEAPPGTRPDNAPPRPVELRPDYGERVPGFDGTARVRFDEPLLNPRNLGRDVVGSPAGRYDVRPARNGIDVRPEDGWQDGVIYYIRLPAGIDDLLRNRTSAPVEWLFSTGGEVPDTEVTGRAIDRVSARGQPGSRLLFLGADSVPYTTVTDTGGVFRLPGLPHGAYEAIAFEDQDRDFTYDREFEPGGTAAFELDADAPAAELELLILPADTTAPVLASAAATDSFTLRLEFDDPLDPDADLSGAAVFVRDTVSGADVAVAEFVVGPLPLAPPDTMPGADDGAEGEAEAAADDEPAAEADAEPAEPARDDEPAAGADGEPAAPDLEPASTFVTVRLAEALAAGVYEAEISGMANLRGLVGGGSAVFVYEPPPEPEPEPPAEGEAPAENEAPAPEQEAPPEDDADAGAPGGAR